MYLVSLWKHGIQLLVCEGPVPFIDFPLPSPRLELLWGHAHQVTWRKQKRIQTEKRDTTKRGLGVHGSNSWLSLKTKTKEGIIQTWCWGGHVHSWCSNGSLSRGEKRCWGSHLTGRGFIPPRLPLTGPWGWSLAYRLISSVCSWGLSPAAPMTRGLSFCLRCFVPTVLTNATGGSTVARCGVARCVPARGGSTWRCVAGSGVPHTGAGSGPWGLTAFRAARGFVPSGAWGCVCRGVSWSLQGTKAKKDEIRNRVKKINSIKIVSSHITGFQQVTK